jgi:hypothetical protein
VPDYGLKADQLDQLRAWGAGLQNDSRAEVAAAGKAISLLVEEIERLHVVIWDQRLSESRPGAEAPVEDVQLSLAERVRRATGLAPDPQPVGEREAVSTPFPQEGSRHPTQSREGAKNSTEWMACPRCAEQVRRGARICPHCELQLPTTLVD